MQTTSEVKVCGLCSAEKALHEFNKNTKKPDGLQSRCRDCTRRYGKGYYKANKARMRRMIDSKDAERQLEIRRRVRAFLEAHPCVDCDEADIVVLDFDHVRGRKITNVGNLLAQGASWAAVEAEISKCEVRCANCHRRRTARVNKSWRLASEEK